MISWNGHAARWSQSKKLASLAFDFVGPVTLVLADLEDQGFQPKIHYGWRSVEQQAEIVAKGRSKVSFSFHNVSVDAATPAALAADIIDQRWAWGLSAQANGFWSALGEAAELYDLHWGGRWKSPDVAHVQLYDNSELARFRKDAGF